MAHCSCSSLFYSNRLAVYASICHSSFSTVRGCRQLPIRLSEHIIASCSIFHPNCHRLRGKWIFRSLKLCERQHSALRGHLCRCFHIHFGFWWAFLTKQKQINTLLDRRQNSLLRRNDTKMQREERESERQKPTFFFFLFWLLISIRPQNENVAWGVDLWPKTISLHLSIFCLPMADKIDRIHRYFMMQEISCY